MRFYFYSRLMAALLRNDELPNPATSQENGGINPIANSGETVQVVDDEDEVTTIRRPILPDLMA